MLTAALAGCALIPERTPPESHDEGAAEAAALADLLGLLESFAAADRAQRSAMYLENVSALALEPSAENRLRLALLQGWPGHAHSRPDDALRLADLVLEDETLDEDVRDLAQVLRFWIASRQVEERRGTRLRARVSDLEARIAALQRQLAELTEIERVTEPGSR